MTDESENPPDENTATDDASESNDSAGNPEKEVPSVTGSTEQAFEAAMAEATLEAAQIAKQALDPAMVRATVEAAQIAKQSFDPAMVEAAIEVQSSFNAALSQLNSPSVAADISTVSKTQYSTRDPTPTQESDVDESPPIDVDQIRPPETRVHDQLIWDDGKWYRDRTRELSIHLVDYIFWKAKEGSELTDATDKEISIATTAAAFIITLALTWNPVYTVTVSGATGKITETSIKAAKSRSDRKDLSSKFNDGDE